MSSHIEPYLTTLGHCFKVHQSSTIIAKASYVTIVWEYFSINIVCIEHRGLFLVKKMDLVTKYILLI